ncbi:tetratricopeptide repeat protein [Myxococcota bacterium]|nr:tetratricopeptide repeat protein [Myxococcota bacterium]
MQALLVVSTVIAVLVPTLGAEFIWDDRWQIVGADTLSDPRRIPGYFSQNVRSSFGLEGPNGPGVDLYRPLFVTALALQRIALGGPDPAGFHAFALGWHALATALLWALSRRWLRSDAAAALVAALFAFHPVTAEAYLFVSAQCEPMAASGLLAAALVLDRLPGAGRTRQAAGSAAAGALLLAGLLSKETVLLALPPLSYVLWRRGVSPRLLAGAWAAIPAYLALRLHALSGLQATGQGTGDRLEAARNAPILLADALRALVAQRPIGIRHLSYEYRALPDAWVWGAAVAVAAAAAGVWAARRAVPLMPVAAAALVGMLAPVTLVTAQDGWGGFGRYLYLPWGLLALAGVQAGLSLPGRRRAAALVLALVFGGVELASVHRALAAWGTERGMAEAAVTAAPSMWRPRAFLADVIASTGDARGAIPRYREALSLEPGYAHGRRNLAALLLATGRPEEARAEVEILRRRGATDAVAEGIGVRAILALGDREGGLARLAAARSMWPDDPELRALEAQALTLNPAPSGAPGSDAPTARASTPGE